MADKPKKPPEKVEVHFSEQGLFITSTPKIDDLEKRLFGLGTDRVKIRGNTYHRTDEVGYLRDTQPAVRLTYELS